MSKQIEIETIRENVPSSDSPLERLVRPPRVLIACEYSGTVRDAFTRLGAFAMSCDLLPSETEGNHYQGDVRDILSDSWDLMIAHPPCTYLSYVGNRHWNKPGRDKLRSEAMKFFWMLYDAPIARICVENPVGLPNTIFRKPNQIIHPYYFGDPMKKRTCLWIRGLPLLRCDKNAKEPKPVYHLKTTGKAIHWTEAMHGGKKRSKSFNGIANAMAEQWYPLLTRTA